MHHRVLVDATDALRRAQSSNDVRSEVEKFARRFGFDNFAYSLSVNVPSFKPMHIIINGYPTAWAERYLSLEYFKIDPIVKRARETTLPSIWQDNDPPDAGTNEFWEEARASGLSNGLTVSIHDRPGALGIFSVSRDRPIDLDDQALAALIGYVQTFANVLHHTMYRLELAHMLPANVALTARESECLKWTAEGKTAWEVGQIMGITERTAVFHINNVMHKLGASNKTQAIVRAVALKLV